MAIYCLCVVAFDVLIGQKYYTSRLKYIFGLHNNLNIFKITLTKNNDRETRTVLIILKCMQQFLPEKILFFKILKGNVAINCSSVVAFVGLIDQKYYTSSFQVHLWGS